MPRASYNTLPNKHYPGKDYFRTNCYYCNIRFNAFGLMGGKAVCTSCYQQRLQEEIKQDVYGRNPFDADPWDK